MSVVARLHPCGAVRLPTEIAFLAGRVPASSLERAADHARTSGTDAATALLNLGLLDEETFYRALALRLGADFVQDVVLGAQARYRDVVRVSAAPLAAGGAVVAAPRGRAIARLIASRDADPSAHAAAITTPTRLRLAAFAHHGAEIAASASGGLAAHRPEWSCLPGAGPLDLALAGAVIALVLVTANLPNGFGLLVLGLLQCAALAMLTVRLGCVVAGTPPARHPEPGSPGPGLPDARLPTYTVIVALYREARVVPRLVHALARLDYPAAKLQVMFVLEADDAETQAALGAVPMPARFEVVVVPDGRPRTKPRALNVALDLARGDLIVVYDAEDVVDPMQLRDAANAFARGPATLAGLQGRLVIDNHGGGWLPKLLAIEYAALFDVLGPALAAWRMPIPLGGTSTHLRTRVLRELHGWDAWNVTEDADLGLRLALAGYRVGDLPSATFEEAPETARAWLGQRTRWMKGFLQTSVTHGRRPLDTLRRLGPADALCALVLVPGTVVSALVYPILGTLTVWRLAFAAPEPEAGLPVILTTATSAAVFLGGLAAMTVPALLGCLRRGWHDLLWYVPLLPLHFVLVGAAAWLAVIELVRHPHRWNKTEHGLSRASRSGALHLRRAAVRAGGPVRPPSPAAAAPGRAR